MTPKLPFEYLKPIPYFKAVVPSFNIPAPGITSKRAAHITVVLSLSDTFEKKPQGGYISYIIYQIICNTYSPNGYSDNLL